MDSAIPQHLRTLRTRERRVPDDYAPPYPSYVARHEPMVERVVMAYFGVQHSGDPTDAVAGALARLDAAFVAEDGPGHRDRATCLDAVGFTDVVSVAYWDDTTRFDRWFAAHGAAWTADERGGEGVGYYTELLRPSVQRYETLFSAPDRAEGVAVLADGMSDMVQEHAYWGGARDRIPLSQRDGLDPDGAPKVVTVGRRRQVVPHGNLCLIRSGQDWGDTDEQERGMYLTDVEPVLRAGMDFLRDKGVDIGCFANRYLTVLDAHGTPVDKTYGMSWWRSLADLERWAESHPTHLAIFGAAMTHLSTLGPAAQLRLYHEVTVAAADEQFFEYLGCHDRTGMLTAAV